MAFAEPHVNIGVSADIHQLLVMARAALGVSIADVADEALLIGLQQIASSHPRLQRMTGLNQAIEARTNQHRDGRGGDDGSSLSGGADDPFAPNTKRRRRRTTKAPKGSKLRARTRNDSPGQELQRFVVRRLAEEDPDELTDMMKQGLHQSQAARLGGSDEWMEIEFMREDPEFRERMKELRLQTEEAQALAFRAEAKAKMSRTRASLLRNPADEGRGSPDSVLPYMGLALLAGLTMPQSVRDQLGATFQQALSAVLPQPGSGAQGSPQPNGLSSVREQLAAAFQAAFPQDHTQGASASLPLSKDGSPQQPPQPTGS